jgi:hypothetical protein
MGQALEVVNQFYDLYLNQHSLIGLDRLLATDFHFVGPLAASSSAAEHVQLLKQVLPALAGWKLVKQFTDREDVITIYEMYFNAPNGQRISVPMTEWSRVLGGQLTEQKLYYDPRELAQALQM